MMGHLVELARSVMEEGEGPVAEIDGTTILVAEGIGERGNLTVFTHAREADEQLVVYAMRPDKAPVDRRSSVGEFFTRANFMLAVGNFELDLDDGEMRFKVSVDSEGVELHPRMVGQMLRTAIASMDLFSPGIDRVLAGDATPARILDDLGAD